MCGGWNLLVLNNKSSDILSTGRPICSATICSKSGAADSLFRGQRWSGGACITIKGWLYCKTERVPQEGCLTACPYGYTVVRKFITKYNMYPV